MKGATESGFQATVVQYARLRGWRVVHVPKTTLHRRGEKVHMTAVAYDGKGFPDLVLVRDDRLVFAELKSATGRTSVEQEAWLAALRLTTAEVYLWKPSDWDEVVRVLE